MSLPGLTFDFSNRVALVTGGARGIGLAVSRSLVSSGAQVGVHFHSDRQAAERLCKEIEDAGGRAKAIQGELGDPISAEGIVEQCLEAFGRIDILVNNAGVWNRAPIDTMDRETWSRLCEINIGGVVHCCRVASRSMKRHGKGSIINISSTAGQRGEAHHSHYAASKGALIAFTKSLAPELAPWGIRTNCVAPGWVETDMTRHVLERPDAPDILKLIPAGRFGDPAEIAAAVLFLASDAASYINGEVLNVNGGSVLCG